MSSENYSTYNHARSVRQGDNQNKETLMNISDLAYGHSLVVSTRKLVWGGGYFSNRLDASVPDRGPRSTIRYLQRGSKPNSGVVLLFGGYPVNGAISRVGEIPQQNMFPPVVSNVGACKLACSERGKSHQWNKRGLWGGNPYRMGTPSRGNPTTEGFDSHRTIEKDS